jgi:hypothetical protein
MGDKVLVQLQTVKKKTQLSMTLVKFQFFGLRQTDILIDSVEHGKSRLLCQVSGTGYNSYGLFLNLWYENDTCQEIK